METYAGAPYFHILDHKPSPHPGLEKVAQIRSQTIDALKNGQPFVYIRSTAIGDNFILDWSIKQILSKLCLKESIPLSNIKISNLSRNEGSKRSPSYKRIDDNFEIKSFWDSQRQGFRWTQIGEYPAIPDGGLHVKTTKEIGKIDFINQVIEQGKQKIIISI